MARVKRRGAHIAPFVSLAFLLLPPAHSYPQFQMYVEKHSNRAANCSMCHTNDNGPTGDGPGQIGSLTAQQQALLDQEHAAMLPGQDVHSPILNKFGNYIIHRLGRAKFLQLIADPSKLSAEIGYESDLDGDGIPDAIEFQEGTHPLNKFSGDPWRLLTINMRRNWRDILLAVVAVAAFSYGFSNLLRGITLSSKQH